MNEKRTLLANTLPAFDGFSDRRFEQFTHRLFSFRIADDLKGIHDEAKLMSGVGEKGRDVSLFFNGLVSGVVQCKLNTSSGFTKPNAIKEIIKFVLHSLADKSLIPNIDSFIYYLVISHKAANTTIELLNNFNKKVVKEPKLEEWTNSVINSYQAFSSLTYQSIEKELKDTLQRLQVKLMQDSDISEYIFKDNELRKEFFEVSTVIETEPVTKILEEINKNIVNEPTEKIAIFKDQYKRIATPFLSSVRFLGHAIRFNKPQNMCIENLYVSPFFDKIESDKNVELLNKRKSKKLTSKYIINNKKHTIVLGAPGAGKSLLVKSLILSLFEGGDVVPFRIELRKYIQEKKRTNLSILDYLPILFKSEYQIDCADKDMFESIVSNSKTVFLFDGLDEIFDIAQKEKTANDIVNFCRSYPLTRSIITSRFIGFNDVEFDEGLFDKLSITPFDNSQIERFIDNFFATQINVKEVMLQDAKDCKKQIESVSDDLKSNPLILSLMSMLALNSVKIPDSKLEVYQSITETLVEKRDREEKELQFDIKNVKNLKGAFSSLAFWQYTQNSSNKKVTNDMAIQHLANYLLLKNNCEEEEEARESAEHFLNYAEQRSIYFDNSFTHKTFSEYYSANFIYINYNNNPSKINIRDRIIKEHLGDPAWHVVFELLFSMVDKHVDDFDVITDLFHPHINTKSALANLFLLSQITLLSNIDKHLISNLFSNALKVLLSSDLDYQSKDAAKLFQKVKVFVSIPKYFQLLKQIVLQMEKNLKSESANTAFYELSRLLSNGTETRLTENDELFNKAEESSLLLYNLRNKNKFSLKECRMSFNALQIFEQIKIPYGQSSFYLPLVSSFLSSEPDENEGDEYEEFINLIEDVDVDIKEAEDRINWVMQFSNIFNNHNFVLNLFKCYSHRELKNRAPFKSMIKQTMVNSLNQVISGKKSSKNDTNQLALIDKLRQFVDCLDDEGSSDLLEEILLKEVPDLLYKQKNSTNESIPV